MSGVDHKWGGTIIGDNTLPLGDGASHACRQGAGTHSMSEDGTRGDSTLHGPPSLLGHSVVPTVRATMPGSIPNGTQCIGCGSLPGSHKKASE